MNLSSSRELLAQVLPDTEVVGIDEGQFFDAELPAVCSTLADQGKRVIVAGLDQDYLGKPFEPMPQLLAIAEYITKTLAICMVCGVASESHAAARRQQRTGPGRRARVPTRPAAATASIHPRAVIATSRSGRRDGAMAVNQFLAT